MSGRITEIYAEMQKLKLETDIIHKMVSSNTDRFAASSDIAAKYGTPEEFAEKLLQYDVISFDMFDTLVFRTVYNPNDIFTFIAERMGIPRFIENRKTAVRSAKAQNKNKAEDYYNIFQQFFGVDKHDLLNEEINAERQLVFANPYMKRVYDVVRAVEEKRVIVVSNMHLSEEFLKELLVINGYKNLDAVYVSCEHGTHKGGKLFEVVLSELQVNADRVCHVGDNHTQDIDAPKKLGIRTFLYHNVNSVPCAYFPHGFNSIRGSLYKSLVAAKLYCGFPLKHAYEFGYAVGGIMTLGYSAYLKDLSQKLNVDKIIFLGRDCFSLSKVYQQLSSEETKTEPEIVYAEMSRYALFSLMFSDYTNFWDYYLGYILNAKRTVGEQFSAKRLLGVDFSKYNEINILKVIKEIMPTDISNLICDGNNYVKVMNFLNENKNQILDAIRPASKNADLYYRKILGNSKNVLIVDAGWIGTMPYLLKRYYEKTCGVTAQVSLFGYRRANNIANFYNYGFENTTSAFTADPILLRENFDDSRLILESIFSCGENGMCIGFNADLSPRFAEYDSNYQEMQELSTGVIDFCADWHQRTKKFQEYSLLLRISNTEAMLPFYHIMSTNKMHVMESLGFERGNVTVRHDQTSKVKKERGLNGAVLYYVGKVTYMLINNILRLTKFRDKKAVLLVRASVAENEPLFQNMVNTGLYDDIITANFSMMKKQPDADETRLESAIIAKFDTVFRCRNYDVTEFDNIVIQNDANDVDFEIYLCAKNNPYFFYELFPNCFNHNIMELHRTALGKDYEVYLKIQKRYDTMHGDSMVATPVFDYRTDIFASGYVNKERLLFNIDEGLTHIGTRDRDVLLQVYNYNWTRPEACSALLILQGWGFTLSPVLRDKDFTSHFNPPNQQWFSIFAAQNYIDFFTDNEMVYIKTHPNLPIGDEDYKAFFDCGRTQVLSKIPSELLVFSPDILEHTFNTLVCVGSTAGKFFNKYDTGYFLGRNASEIISKLNRLYFAIYILNECRNLSAGFECFGLDGALIVPLIKKITGFSAVYTNSLTLSTVGQTDILVIILRDTDTSQMQKMLGKLKDDSVAIILCEKMLQRTINDIFGIHEPNSVRKRIKKHSLKNNLLFELFEEEFYIFSRDKDVLKFATDYECEKKLKNVGISICCEKNS